jgi:hypothetical protein
VRAMESCFDEEAPRERTGFSHPRTRPLTANSALGHSSSGLSLRGELADVEEVRRTWVGLLSI